MYQVKRLDLVRDRHVATFEPQSGQSWQSNHQLIGLDSQLNIAAREAVLLQPIVMDQGGAGMRHRPADNARKSESCVLHGGFAEKCKILAC